MHSPDQSGFSDCGVKDPVVSPGRCQQGFPAPEESDLEAVGDQE